MRSVSETSAKAPNFFILGAQKAGTTYLSHVLSRHDDVFFSDPKEPLFFSRVAGVTPADYARYVRDCFGAAADQRWRGEGSTTYLQWPIATERIAKFIPRSEEAPRFIVCLRQPLEKAVSFFIHNWRRARYAPGTSLTDVLDEPITLSPYRSSRYADSIERWFKHFAPEQFLFVAYDDLQRDAGLFARRATGFLGIAPPREVPSTVINGGLPLIWREGVLTLKGDADAGGYRPAFSKDELDRLQDRFLPDIARTETLTGLDLSAWRKAPEIA